MATERGRGNQDSTLAGAIPDNTVGTVTPQNVRDSLQDVTKSAAWLEDFKPVTATGTDTYTCSMSNTLTTYSNGRYFLILFTNANTGAATLNVDSIGAIAIKKGGSTALASGDIADGSVKLLAYDGTNFQIISGEALTTSSVTSVTVDVSSAEILALFTTPKTLISAPGANKIIFVLGLIVHYKFVSAAYSQAGGLLSFRYNNGSGASVNASGLTMITGVSDGVVIPQLGAYTSPSAASGVVNKAVVLCNSVADPTTGSGTLKISISYRIVDVS